MTACLPLPLTASDTNWRLFTLRKADPGFQNLRQRVLARDQHTCQYCGFRSQQCLEIVNRDGNYQKNGFDNLVSACPLCFQCHFIESVGHGDFGGGVLVYLPHMTQNELNALCHVLFASLVFKTTASTSLGNVYRSMKLTSQSVEKELGEGMSQPAMLGRVLIDTPKKETAALEALLNQKVRLLPNLQRYDQAVWTWSQEALSTLLHLDA